MARNPVPIWYLRECLMLDQATGRLTWRRRPVRHFANKGAHARHLLYQAGRLADEDVFPLNGYRRIRLTFNGKRYGLIAHRVVFALFHGRWPTHEVDHIDRCRTNNAPANLRDVPHVQNMRNSRAADRSRDAS